MDSLGYVVLGAIIGIYLFWRLAKARRRHISRRRAMLARRGEDRARHFLERAGYNIVGLQEKVPIKITIDGETHASYVKADAIVTRGGYRYVAEVKTGKAALPQPLLRRQLLEYFLAFKAGGMLLVNGDTGKISRVEIDTPFANQSKWYLIAVGFVAGFIMGIWVATRWK
ncbi:MAG: hypothetical protein AB1510_03620 [Bacillota bacterium]